MSSTMGVTPRFAPRGARELIDDIDLLLDHLGRTAPGRLEACFDDSRGTIARSLGVADPPQVPADLADEGGAVPPGPMGRPTKAAFIRHIAEVARRAADAKTEAGADLNAEWREFAGDLAFLIQARDFLATLAQPATLDTVRLTRAYISELLQQRKRSIGWRTAPAAPPNDDASAGSRGAEPRGNAAVPPRNHAEFGAALAVRMARLRRRSKVCVAATLLISLYVFTGKAFLEEGQRARVLLGKVNDDIVAAISAEVVNAPASAAAARLDVPPGAAARKALATSYCDQPFLDDDGVVRYAPGRQETLCNRLWGANGYINRMNQSLDAWSTPFVRSPLGLVFGVTTWRDALRPFVGWRATGGEPPPSHEGGAVRIFAENARLAGAHDALRLAVERMEAENGILPRSPQAGGALVASSGGGDGTMAGANAGVLADPGSGEAGRDRLRVAASKIVDNARYRFRELGYLERDHLLRSSDGVSTPLQATAVIEGIGLYVLPCLYALLGAFVAVFRNIARKGDAWLLDPLDPDRATQTLVLGVVFGAVVGLLADVLRANGTAQATDAGTVVLGVSALALLAGYSVGHVFGLLDAFSERVFGRRDAATGRPGAA